MMAFQIEPDHQNEPTTCDRCHEPVIIKLTSESEPYCSHCGFVFGTDVAPSTWVCEECSETVLHHGGNDRPWCETCALPMSCCHASPSGVHGTGLGTDLDLGFRLLLEADKELMAAGWDILQDIQRDILHGRV